MIPLSLREEISLLVFGLAILAICGIEAVLLIRYVVARIRRGSWKSIRFGKFAIVLHALTVTVIACFVYASLVEPYRIDVNHVTIRTAKLRQAGFRIAHISDLHCDTIPRNEERTIRIINEFKPDVIVLTGDCLNDAAALPRLQTMLQRLEAPLGKLAVKGNFEIRRWSSLDLLGSTGFRWLEGDTVAVEKAGETIMISGLGFDQPQRGRDILQRVPEGSFNVFLFHTPDLIEAVCGPGVDLYLCGHTHGGQVALPGYGALITFSKFGKKYESGRYESDGTILYVNRGLGLEPRPAPQVRFCARPEIAVFDVVPE